ncbi:MAG: hypothetical protein OIF57_11895 [Marinobacterium sp.]|nr:hypothetical protein [Marinobacterium sp.]
MKINQSQIAFQTSHERQESIRYHEMPNSNKNPGNNSTTNQLSGAPSWVLDTHINYSSESTARRSTTAISDSIIRNGDNEQVLHQLYNSYELTRHSLGAGLKLSNLQPGTQTPGTALSLYQDVDSLAGSADKSVSASRSSRESTSENALVSVYQHYRYQDQESLKVLSAGTITTEDGREISFKLDLSMQRSFELAETLHIGQSLREVVDPLVINFKGGTTSLTNSSFSFDLNADGSKEEVSFVGRGSGFLVFDHNGDGTINDGSEMFGTQSGNGFAELAMYDGDHNLWIDENDSIYNKLQIWHEGDNGRELISLKDAGIGAIYLGAQQSEFNLTDSHNNLLGQVKSTALFLKENGEVGSVQQVDLAVHDGGPTAQQQRLNEMTEEMRDAEAEHEETVNLQIAALALANNWRRAPEEEQERGNDDNPFERIQKYQQRMEEDRQKKLEEQREQRQLERLEMEQRREISRQEYQSRLKEQQQRQDTDS